MTTQSTLTSRTGRAPNGRAEVATSLIRPRRSPVHIAAGALLVVVAAVAFMWLQLRADRSVEVLAVARPVPAGQVIAAADLRVAKVVPDPSLELVEASQAASLVGRTAAVPLIPGALLSAGQVGPPAWPAKGEAVVALPLKPGRIPAGVAPGARVQVLQAAGTPDGSGGSGGRGGALATVVAVADGVDASSTVVVSLLLKADAAASVAAAGGEATLVLLGPAG